jgi:ketosteroid isomerase-like protein
MGKALETVNRFYDITENKKGKGLEAMLAEDMTFVGPLMKTTGAEEYINSTKQFLQMHKTTRMLKQFENENDVCSIYEMDIATPAGGTITLELTDWIQVANGRVVKQKIYYDPREFAKAFGMADGF